MVNPPTHDVNIRHGPIA